MSKKICLIHANCQGEGIIKGLYTSPNFAAQYHIRHITNYSREPFPQDLLKNCDLFLYQYLGEEWNELSSEYVLSQLPAGAKALCIPNYFYNGYWPLWDNTPGFNYRDIYLDELLDSSLSNEEIMILYMRGRIPARHDFTKRITASLIHEQKKESHTPIKYLTQYEKYAGSIQLFNTVNHPAPVLMAFLVRSILDIFGFPHPPDVPLLKAVDFAPEFEHPIHPTVAKTFNLSFAPPEREYHVYGTPMTFARYIGHYIECRRAEQSDFISYLCSFAPKNPFT
ncbi:MAG: WcbI family polysaccharide biosynthesis putative acetyltransferase [Desulfovibrio sp.]